ncbi:GNAT family N-acetyltransferase [Allohahella marinimesophila]|uniref:L-ornithine N(alpha)-acyltransferase n=1 Tax=Allohahella marinimesophila TaxID=1054972 RepID=A0ABP7Q4P7_9GAMM
MEAMLSIDNAAVAIKTSPAPRRAELFVKVARTAEEIRAAQRLRFQIFTEEYGADLQTTEPNLDVDHYDEHCDHLLVFDNISGQVVATTRLLDDAQAVGCGGFYSESEFDLAAITALPGRKLEVGRTCVAPAYRNGATLALLWSGIARYVLDNNYDYLLGCGSISVADGFDDAWNITRQIHTSHLIAPALQVQPRQPLPQPAETLKSMTSRKQKVMIPPLIRAYLRLGARIGGDPCWDPHFRCADLFILLEVSALEARYARHFLKE